MKLLALDSTATPASAAVVEDGKLLGEFFINTRQTHSQTLLPMAESVLRYTETEIGEIGLFAVSAGPGSFTGVRIGVACIKGLAMPGNVPCVGVSTLEAMAYNLAHLDAAICAVMDARCGQVYNAVFTSDGETFSRLTEDRALSIDELAKDCEKYKKPLYLVGDGANLCYNKESFQALGAKLPPQPLVYQRAYGVAQAALAAYRQGTTVTPAALAPIYLRLPQAERELKKRLANKSITEGSR